MQDLDFVLTVFELIDAKIEESQVTVNRITLEV